MLTNLEILLEEIAGEVDGTVNPNYSGRGMYGETCWGITCSNPTACIEAAASRGIRGAQQDSMGRGSIIYWPELDIEELNEADLQHRLDRSEIEREELEARLEETRALIEALKANQRAQSAEPALAH